MRLFAFKCNKRSSRWNALNQALIFTRVAAGTKDAVAGEQANGYYEREKEARLLVWHRREQNKWDQIAEKQIAKAVVHDCL